MNRSLFEQHADQLGHEVRQRLATGAAIDPADYRRALDVAGPWRAELDAALRRTPVIALAAIVDEPPTLEHAGRLETRRPNVAVNLAGHPAIVVPVPRPGGFPTAVQLIAAHGDEDLLCATAAVIERTGSFRIN